MYCLLPILLLLYFGRITSNIERLREKNFVEASYRITGETFLARLQ
jgi:hypothetical protein